MMHQDGTAPDGDGYDTVQLIKERFNVFTPCFTVRHGKALNCVD